MVRASCALSFSSKSAAAVSHVARSTNEVFRYDRNALSAFASFSWTSRESIAANSCNVSPVVGLVEAMAIQHLQPQPFWNQEAIQQIETPLNQERQDSSRDRALQNRDVIIQVQAAENRFAQAAGANQRGERGRADIDHGAGFYSAENRARRDRQIDFPKPGGRLEAERSRGLAQRLRDVLESGRRVADNRQQSVKKKRGNRRSWADSEKRDWNQQRQKRQRRNRLDGAGETKNGLADQAAPAGRDAERNSDEDRKQKRNARQLEMTRSPAPELV